jgi:branched-chain amino acid transport system ATP-binding protein
MLKIANLEAGYGSLRVIKGVSLHVSPGEVVAIIGPNGAGKTTLLATIAGLIKPWTGEISLEGRRIEQAPPEQIVALGCSLVPEGRQVFGSLTVQENLLLGGYVRRRERDSAQTLEGIYRRFGVLRERERQLAATLSGGQQQMLALGRALMARPRLIMMDEPSLGLAPIVIRTIFETIRELREAGMTILLVEQNARSALRVADRGYVLETGQIVCDGSARELLDNRDVQRAYLGKDFRTIDE